MADDDKQKDDEREKGIDPKEFEKLQKMVAKLEANNAELLKEKKEAKEAADKAAMEAAKKGGDLEALEASWKKKLEESVAAKESELGQYKQMVNSLTVGATATKLASEVFGEHAELMLPHVQSRLSVELAENKPSVRVLVDGKPSALTVDDLAKELRNNPRMAAFVVGSKANGAGAHGGQGAQGQKTMKRSEYENLNPSQKMELGKEGVKLTDG